jgi:exopolysaccharide biosynthesis polyprenyl glycosylphosphotransferase
VTIAGSAEASSALVAEQLTSLLDDRTREIIERRRNGNRLMNRGWLLRRMLLAADVLGLSLAFLGAEILLGTGGAPVDRHGPVFEFLAFTLALPVWVLVARLYGLYDRDEERTDHSTVDEFMGVFNVVSAGTWILFMTVWLTHLAEPNPPRLAVFWILAITLVTAGRAAARAVCRRSVAYLQNTIIVGAGDVGQLVARKLLQHPEYGINLVGFVDGEPKERRADLGHLTLLGATEELPRLVRLFDIERVIVAFSKESHAETLELVRSLRDIGLQIDIVPRLFEVVGPNVGLHTVEGLPLVGLPPVRLSRSSRVLKRTVDLIGAASALVFAAPLFAFIAWRINRDSPGPVFFRQTRLGRGMREFTVLKFRTMKADTDPSDHREFIKTVTSPGAAPQSNGLFKLEGEETVTRVGRWLRRTSLDELPQLINVLRGEMSLVGPRPCLPYEVENFAPYHFERFRVPAGLTGLWQVTARAHSSFGEALDMDVAYARAWSLGLDLQLVLRTPIALLRQRRGTR